MDAFEMPADEPELEIIVTILNINPGHNEELKKKCPIIGEYTIFLETVRKNAKRMSIDEAVENAVDEWIKNNVLYEFLRSQKAEVIKMSIYEYDEERELQLIRQAEREIARMEEQKKNAERA